MEQNWQHVKEVFYEALAKSDFDRPAFLDEACVGNAEFRSQVEVLLDSYRSGFLEDSAWPDVIGEESKPQFEEGTQLGNYRIVKMLGRGGMGDVYEAIDLSLDRRVALKFLSESLRNDKSARKRFHKEAQAIAMLEHPNICAVYGIDQAGDDDFMVMQYVDGVPLDQALRNIEIDQTKFVSIARQIAGAVAFAHENGIIHRDLKPANIMLTGDGTIKVLDFGLAKIVEQKNQFRTSPESINLSGEGLIAGTVAYMSPEQLRGEPLDYQTDIFSLGVIFYELVSKANPFPGKNKAEIISAVLRDDPITETNALQTTAPDLVGLIGKCIEKKKEDRFQDIGAIITELDAVGKGVAISHRGSTYARRIVAAIALLFAIVASAFLGISYYSGKNLGLPAFASSRPQVLAILPFTVDEAIKDKEYLAEDMTQSIAAKLSKLSSLKIRNLSSVSRYKNKNVEPLTVCQNLGCDAVLSGTIVNTEGKLSVRVDLRRAADNSVTNSKEFLIDEPTLTEDLSADVAEKLKINLTEQDKGGLVRRETESSEARSLYLTGRYHLKLKDQWNDIPKAIAAFTQAKDIDPNYAKAWGGLAVAYLLQSTPGAPNATPPAQSAQQARTAAAKAVELDPTISDGHYAFGQINSRYEWNWPEAESNYRNSLSIDPDFTPARIGLIGVLRLLGRHDEALEHVERIRELDPLSVTVDVQTALILFGQRDFARMGTVLTDALSRSPGDKRLIYVLVYQLVLTGRASEAVEMLRPMYETSSEDDKILLAAPLGLAYGKSGMKSQANAIIRDLTEFGTRRYVPAQEKVLINIALHDYDGAFENLRKSCEERFASFPSLVDGAMLDEIRQDPRFAEIKRCANL